MRLQTGDFELDTEAYELRRGGVRVPLEPQVFDVLALLVEHRDRVVTKEELLDTVWGNRFVSDSALTSRIRAVRRVLGDDGQAQRFIRTVHGRGYQFVGAVAVVAEAARDDRARFARTAGNLPSERTPLFGRSADIALVTEQVRGNRLVSLLGIGGTGKTRLAVSAARELTPHFADGVWFADLVPVRDRRGLVTATAHAMGVGLSAGSGVEQLAATVDGRDLLLVLDNCEHVRAEAVALVDELLARTTTVHLLVTSREPLGLADECRVVVEPLGIGSEAQPGPAVDLLVAAARRVGVVLGPDDMPAARALCARLDGLPLAVELAAAQLRVLSPDALLARVDQRFALLRRNPVAGRRQASLVGVLADTWSMLDREEQELLTQLGAFPGRFDLSDAEQLDPAAPATARVLAGLADRSLVVPGSDREGFHLLETVRLFARHHDERGRHALRHAQWCLDTVGDDAERHVLDPDLAVWCQRHWDDLRAAERRLLTEGREADAARLVAAPAYAMHVDVGSRAVDTLARVEEYVTRAADPAIAARLHLTGVFSGMATRSPEAIARHGSAAVEAAGDADADGLLAMALVLASWSRVLTDAEAAVAMVREAARLAVDAGRPRTAELADSYLAYHLAWQRRYDDAVAVAEQVLAGQTEGPGAGGGFVALVGLAAITALSDPGRARGYVPVLIGSPSPEHAMWGNLVLAASVFAAGGEVESCVALVQRVRERLGRAGRDWLPDLLVPAAVLAHHIGANDRAARWTRAVHDAGRPTQSFPVTFVYRRLRERVGLAVTSPFDEHSLDEIGAEALGWLSELGS